MIFKFYRASFFVGMIGKKPSQESLDCQTKNQIRECSDYGCLRFLPTSKNEKCENIYIRLIQMNSQNSSGLKVRRNCYCSLAPKILVA